MKKMNGINIDKWRVLNKTLFEAYISTYKKLQDNPSFSAPETLVKSFEEHGILETLTKDGYGTAYTIAREIGIYYEDNGTYVLSKMSQSYLDGKLSYPDYIKYYCLNIEFLINNVVVHPFSEILEVLNGHEFDKNEIAQRCPKLVPANSPSSVIDCLRLFLNRCVEAELLIVNSGKYRLAFSYNLLVGSLNKSSLDSTEFEQKFILGDQKNAQKNIVTILIEREITQLFKNSFTLISKNPIPIKSNNENSSTHKKGKFDLNSFHLKAAEAGLIFSPQLIQRFIASLCTKPFVICSGLSGSGKTKLAQAFAQWITADKSQYEIVPVGADWTNREPLLGYPNALKKEEYVTPENGVLDLMIRAKQNIENAEEPTKPYFLILDEMNLSHVERYFADFLSTMESGDAIPLHKIVSAPGEEKIDIPQSIKLPRNLFIIGTVNIDETTYMFSPKVLDRANTIEFRLTEKDLHDFIQSDIELNMDLLTSQGANMGESFMDMALLKTDKNLKLTGNDLQLFFSELKKSGAEFGYRTASEIGRLMKMLELLGEKENNLLDIAIMQKLLPKLHGSRNKLTKVLPVLGGFCLENKDKIKEAYLDKFVSNGITVEELNEDTNIKYKISFEKICRMYKNAVENGFASYAEA
jgi:5-methylcytosine-specific restriction protein B